ncbi:MAG: tRNA preQ1(34) S-adenosylmethionine ribosyltransferase-isomerase QueA [Thermoanaerobaculia bacterium]
MPVSDYDYDLPRALIAQEPIARGHSRLLTLLRDQAPAHRNIRDLPALLDPGDLLVVNNTRVIAARLFGRRPGGGRSEILLVEPRRPRRAVQEAVDWICLGHPRKRMRPGTRLRFSGGLLGKVVDHLEPDRLRIRFSDPPAPLLEHIGHVPLPPYISRPDSPADRERYQTVYAEVPGAIAAPTAGLHFDRELLDAIGARGVEIAKITLHVGPGTFRPIASDDIEGHRMEAERYEIDGETATALERACKRGGRVIAVGTTVVRALEAAALAGDGRVEARGDSTDLFIKPGFEFRVVDRLLTNFHLPRSTLLVLVCALAGRERLIESYRQAVGSGYRFYSYGDAMLIDRAAPGE